MVAISVLDNKILAVGSEAREMIGRTPESIVVSRPLVDGAIADYRVTGAMLRYFIKKRAGFCGLNRSAHFGPRGYYSTERRAVMEAGLAGAKEVYLVKEPVLAAIGAKISSTTPGNMILNIGGGTTELAVISLGGIVSSESVRIGGNKLDQAIVEYIKKNTAWLSVNARPNLLK